MLLTHLPVELLGDIVEYSLPEGFESLALTCKQIYTVCTPFMSRHNELRSVFHTFTFEKHKLPWKYGIKSSFDLIERVAVEPIVARYIRHADFGMDRSRDMEMQGRIWTATMRRLLRRSPYFLDWEGNCVEWAAVEEYMDWETWNMHSIGYSQNLAAFLMTLLPNVRTLVLPKQWKSRYSSKVLINEIARRANQDYLPHEAPSLCQVTSVKVYANVHPQISFGFFNLDLFHGFLALPNLQSFHGNGCVAIGEKAPKNRKMYSPRESIGAALTTIVLEECYLDEMAVAEFLENTKRLKKFRYSHSWSQSAAGRLWRIGEFIAAIERKVGAHLEDFSISITETSGSIGPGEVSLRGFQRLQKLELPSEAVLSYRTAKDGSVSKRYQADAKQPLIGNLLPASVTRFSLLINSQWEAEKVLKLMFGHLSSWKESRSPALEKISLTTRPGKSDDYLYEYNKLLRKTEKMGIALHAEEFEIAQNPS